MRHRQKFLLFRIYRFRDTEAYGELYEFFVPRIRRYISFRVADVAVAEELTAEVFLRGWEYATASLVKNPGALFYRIAKNVIADFYRKRKAEVDIEEVAEPESKEEPVSETMVLQAEQANLLANLKELKEEYRDVLVMKYLDEMSVAEIAEVLEKTKNNVRVLLHRAKKALRQQMEK
ncbi:RNA polymerase sigma factor [Candidatus Parcubacteria bacterium]|nr:MAG: RNA polymerase sigma factor [Candidatus Parcubacteria bacterium]